MALIYTYTHTHTHTYIYIRCASFFPINKSLKVRVLQLLLAVDFLPGDPAGGEISLFYYQLRAARGNFSDPFTMSPFPLPK